MVKTLHQINREFVDEDIIRKLRSDPAQDTEMIACRLADELINELRGMGGHSGLLWEQLPENFTLHSLFAAPEPNAGYAYMPGKAQQPDAARHPEIYHNGGFTAPEPNAGYAYMPGKAQQPDAAGQSDSQRFTIPEPKRQPYAERRPDIYYSGSFPIPYSAGNNIPAEAKPPVDDVTFDEIFPFRNGTEASGTGAGEQAARQDPVIEEYPEDGQKEKKKGVKLLSDIIFYATYCFRRHRGAGVHW